MIAVQVQAGPHTEPLTYYAPDDIAPGDVVLVPMIGTVIAIGSEAAENTPEILRVASAAEIASHHG